MRLHYRLYRSCGWRRVQAVWMVVQDRIVILGLGVLMAVWLWAMVAIVFSL